MKRTTTTLDLSTLDGVGLDLDQYLGLWAMDEGRGLLLFDRVTQMDLVGHVQARQGTTAHTAAQVSRRAADGVAIAVVDIRGVMTKQGSSLSSAGSTVRIRRAVRQAANDTEIDAILLRIDSPGGTVAGTADLAREVAAADRQKPVLAFVEDLTASAAYWVASQAGEIWANDPTALIGSIGTYFAIYDSSEAAKKEGIRPVVVRSGEFKGAGLPGTQITDQQQAVWQELVDKLQAEFSAGVAAGRKLSAAKVAELADGRVHLAEDAKVLGLIDGVKTFDETIGRLAELAATRTKQRSNAMSEDRRQSIGAAIETLKPVNPTASYEELAAAVPKADAQFIVGQLKSKATVEQARDAWAAELESRIEAKDKELAEVKAAAQRPGVEPIGSGQAGDAGEESGDPVAEFDAKVRQKMAGGMSRRKAVLAVAKSNRALHEALLRATNTGSKVQQLIGERFELCQ